MVDATSIIDYTYDDFRLGVDHIAKSVSDSGFEPDCIVGIVRGGAVPAVYLSHALKIPVQMVHWNTRDDTEFGNESNCWIPEEIHGGLKVLIVDDIVDGGDTIRELLADWQTSVAGMGNLPVDNVRIAAMIYNTAQDVKPHFYHQTINRNEDQRWVVFPWEA
jgi:hypoxanthine phosphoribosyltransferase